MTCNICQGSRVIRCATFELATAINDVYAPALDPGYEEFPCPKCGPLRVKVERITSIKALGTIREDYREVPGYVDSIKSTIAAQVGNLMLKNGWIDFEEQYDRMSCSTLLRGTAYTAHPTIGREAIAKQKPSTTMVARKVEDKMKITVEFESDVDMRVPAVVTVDGVKYDAVVVDCSVHMDEAELREMRDYSYFRSRPASKVMTAPRSFDLSIDLKCGARAMSEPAKSTEEPPRDPFARELDLE